MSTTGDILIRGGGRDHASRTGKTRNEYAPQAQHLRTSPCAVGTVRCSYGADHCSTKPASHECSFNSANRKIGILLPLSSPHRRLQLMIRAPEVFTSTVRIELNVFVIDTRAGACRHKPDDSLKYVPAHGAVAAGTFTQKNAGTWRNSNANRAFSAVSGFIAQVYHIPTSHRAHGTRGLSSAACRVLLRRTRLRRFINSIPGKSIDRGPGSSLSPFPFYKTGDSEDPGRLVCQESC